MASNAEVAPLHAADQQGGAQRGSAGRRFVIAAVILLVILGALLVGWLPKHKRNEQTAARAKSARSALPLVEVEQVHHASAEQELTLPGTVTPLNSAHIYARAAGFLKARYVDLGDKVRKRQLLALIAAPELDSTVAQSDALLQQAGTGITIAQANLKLQQATYARVHTLLGHGILSQQEDDAAQAAVETAQANVEAANTAVNGARSALQRSRALADFEQVRSPIDGVVTARNVEVGNLVSMTGAAQGVTPMPGSGPTGGPVTGGTQAGELFDVVDPRTLEVFITVPEDNAPFIKQGQPVEMTFSELPEQKFTGNVTRTSDSLSQQTRTLLAEVQVMDPKHKLKPGMFASATLKYKAPKPGILISGDSLVAMARGQFVPVVVNGVIQMRPVKVGRDLGTQVYVTEGLQDGEMVVVNPNDQVQQGAHVTTRPASAGQDGSEAKPGGGAGGKSGGKGQ